MVREVGRDGNPPHYKLEIIYFCAVAILVSFGANDYLDFEISSRARMAAGRMLDPSRGTISPSQFFELFYFLVIIHQQKVVIFEKHEK